MTTRNVTLELILNEPYKIGLALGFKDLTQLHNNWLKDMLFRDDDQTILGHRGSFKTTTLSLFLGIHTIIKPQETVALFRKTDTDTAEVITQTQNMLKSGCMQMICRNLYNKELKLLKETAGVIDTNLKVGVKGQSQISAYGISSSITGKHADIVMTDDIVNVKDRASAAERKKTNLAYMELQNIKNRNGRFINTGTPWHKEDAISTLMPNVRKYDWKSTGLVTNEKAEQLRRSMTASLFAANYELVHIADEDAMFKQAEFFDDEELLYDGIAHIDAAYSTSGDGTAFTIACRREGTFFMFGKRWNKHVDDCLDEILLYMERFRAGSIHMETNGDKGYLAKEIEAAGWYAEPYVEHMNKFIKISTYLKKEWSNIRWLEDTDTEYINEILDYNEHAAHDDSPDSAASIIREFENEITYNPVSGGI